MLELELIRTASDYFKVGPRNAAAKLALNREVQVVAPIIKKASCHAGLHTMITENLRIKIYRLRDGLAGKHPRLEPL